MSGYTQFIEQYVYLKLCVRGNKNTRELFFLQHNRLNNLYFSVCCSYGYGVNRRFYLNKINYSGCEADAGWMFVKRKDCLFDSYRKYPHFLYATNDHAGVWQTEGEYIYQGFVSLSYTLIYMHYRTFLV